MSKRDRIKALLCELVDVVFADERSRRRCQWFGQRASCDRSDGLRRIPKLWTKTTAGYIVSGWAWDCEDHWYLALEKALEFEGVRYDHNTDSWTRT